MMHYGHALQCLNASVTPGCYSGRGGARLGRGGARLRGEEPSGE
jgi:hypothetical protein